MVAPIRDFENITTSTSAIHSTTVNMSPNNVSNMEVDSFDDIFTKACDNCDEVRGRSLVLSAHHSRTLSLSSSDCDEDYATRVQKESDRMDEDNPVATSDSLQLEYATPKSQENQVSKAADPNNNSRQQHVVNIVPALNNISLSSNNMVNVQLSYNINQALDPESWDGNFQAISLHGSIEHLASDIKNIKDSLIRMHKYILGKTIDGNKANSVKDLKSVGKAAWNFISLIYKAHWDSLIVDGSNMSFRNKVKAKFSPQISKMPVNVKDKEVTKSTYVSPLLSPILAKFPKKINEISKYQEECVFSSKKSYMQASSKTSSSNVAMETLKIKEIFLHL